MRRLWARTTAGVIVNVLNRRRPDNDLPRRSVGGIGVRWNLRHRVAEFSHGIQGLVRRRFRGPVPARNLLRDGRARLRSRRGLCGVPLARGRSLGRRHARGRRDLSLLHGPVSRRLLGYRFLGRQLLGRHVLGCRRLGRGVITRRVLRRGLLRGDLSGYGIPACETLGHRHPGYEQLRLGVPLHRRLGRGRQGCGLVGNGRRLPAIRRRLFSCSLLSGSDGTSTVPGSDPARAVTHGRPRRDKQFRSKSHQLCCVQAESAGGSAVSAVISGLSTDRNKTGTPTAITLPNAIRDAAITKRRCEYKAHLLKAAPAPRRIPGKNNGAVAGLCPFGRLAPSGKRNCV